MKMREIMDLNERASAVRVSTAYGDEKKVVVHRNATAMDLHSFFKNKGDLRGILDSSGTIYWWAAEDAVHYDMGEALDLGSFKALYVYPENHPEAEYYERKNDRQPHEAVFLYSGIDKKVIFDNRFVQSYLESGMFDPQPY